ncbi:MAG: hypothetical protein U9R17_02435 [Thermodesulfobacteriota bacterium]|nr:hypothetical protein [Thermodesulfobacteriota bacterium]
MDKTIFKNEKRPKWETREKKIKANEKNRKKASKHQRRNGSKKKTKRNRFGQMENKRKTKSQLIRELVELRQQVGELQASKIKCDQVKIEFE